MVLIIGHRGASYYFLENTKESIMAAISQGAQMVEVDVRATKDKKLVLYHDNTLLRLAKKSRYISGIQLADLRKVRLHGNSRILELSDFLKITNGKITVNLEIKVPHFEEEIVRQIKRHHHQNSAILSSKNFRIIRKIKQIDPKLKVGYVINIGHFSRRHLHNAQKIGAYSIHPSNLKTTHRLIKYVHSLRMRVFPYAINTSGRMKYLINCGVDGIITDRPDLLRKVIKK